ncbi:MAG TPA: fibronectin type III domain-containing protein [Planctomycetota bacterium]|nr:fibronectin type III domain-containing protein [Planctomycetota bacterium]
MNRMTDYGIRAFFALVLFGLIPACKGSNSNSTPPAFGGITGGSSTVTSQATLTWNAAVDYSGTGITYDVAWSLTSGMEDFAAAGFSAAGITTVGTTITGLTSKDTYYFMVRAVDGNGVADANSPEPEFAITIQ